MHHLHLQLGDTLAQTLLFRHERLARIRATFSIERPPQVGGDNHAGPISNHAVERIGAAEPKHLVQDDHLPEIDYDRERE